MEIVLYCIVGVILGGLFGYNFAKLRIFTNDEEIIEWVNTKIKDGFWKIKDGKVEKK